MRRSILTHRRDLRRSAEEGEGSASALRWIIEAEVQNARRRVSTHNC